MSVSRRRVRAIFRKELREYRRNRTIVTGMAILPLIFLVQPLITVLNLGASASGGLARENELLYLLAIPALVPATLAAYSVVGERQQGTLEPVLGTPIRREEFLLGKALASFVPSVRDLVRGLRLLPGLRRDLRTARHRAGAAARLGPARPAGLHPAAGRLVDLGRHRDLHAVQRGPRRSSSSACSRTSRPSW